MKKLYIIGAGTGAEDFLTQRALKLIKSCDVVLSTSGRLSALLAGVREDIKEYAVSEIAGKILAAKGLNIGLLVSGDTGFFSITGRLAQKLEGAMDIEIVCGISSLQYFCARTGTGYENIKIVSLHGRENNILGAVAYNPVVFALTGGTSKAHTICRELAESGLPEIKATVGEKLSMPDERIVRGTVRELSQYIFDDLAVLLLENPGCANPYLPLRDRDFERGEVPMTKEEIRAVTLSKLAIMPSDTVYDIGAGTGSVAIEMARKAFEGCVYAIERKEEAIELIRKNREKLGAYNVTVVSGTAPNALEGLPRPDKAFIGGSSGNMGEIVGRLLEMNPQVHIAANAITIESLNEAVASFEENGLDTDIVCINSAVAKKAGRYHMMNANNPVYIVSGQRGTGKIEE